jgi:hypothetical protein
VPLYRNDDETVPNNYRVISLLPITYRILFNNLLTRLTAYADEIIGDHQCEFRRNK